jgi:hypothetical protein
MTPLFLVLEMRARNQLQGLSFQSESQRIHTYCYFRQWINLYNSIKK